MPKVTGPNTPDVNRLRPGGGFVALYGVAIRNDLTRFRTHVSSILNDLRSKTDMAPGWRPSVKGDSKISGEKEIKKAEKAVKSLETALKSLKGVDIGPMGNNSSPMGPIVAMYGLPPEQDIKQLKANINQLARQISAATKNPADAKKPAVMGDGKLTGTEWKMAKEALAALEKAKTQLKDI